MTRHRITKPPVQFYMNPRSIRNALLLLFIIATLLFFTRCKKPEAVTFPPIKINNITGALKNTDDNCKNGQFYGWFLANNIWTITGENLNTIDGIRTTDKDIDILDWGMKDKNTLIVYTQSDKLDLVNGIFSFLYERNEDEFLEETFALKVVGDKNGFAYKSNLAHMIDFLENDRKLIVAPDFLTDFENVTGDYEPSQNDIILMEGVYWLIMDKPKITANAFQRKYEITADTWDCNGVPREETFEFVTNFDKGIVSNPRNIQKAFTP